MSRSAHVLFAATGVVLLQACGGIAQPGQTAQPDAGTADVTETPSTSVTGTFFDGVAVDAQEAGWFPGYGNGGWLVISDHTGLCDLGYPGTVPKDSKQVILRFATVPTVGTFDAQTAGISGAMEIVDGCHPLDYYELAEQGTVTIARVSATSIEGSFTLTFAKSNELDTVSGTFVAPACTAPGTHDALCL